MKELIFLATVVGIIAIKSKIYKPIVKKDKMLDHPERIKLRRI